MHSVHPSTALLAGGGAPAMESRLSTLATCGFGVQTSLEAHNRLSCPCSADTALKTLPYLCSSLTTGNAVVTFMLLSN